MKGQKSRSGGGVHPYFEGGQTPLTQRLPYRRGFTNIFRTEYSVVNLHQLNIFEPDSIVTPQRLQEVGILKNLRKPVKILAEGNLDRPLVVRANKFSAQARQKIELAGGRVEEVRDTAG
jgi:large subunit ribosomal protein L15